MTPPFLAAWGRNRGYDRHSLCAAAHSLSNTIFFSASWRWSRTESMYGSHMSIATAAIPCFCASVSVHALLAIFRHVEYAAAA
jgi:hypothetical protein